MQYFGWCKPSSSGSSSSSGPWGRLSSPSKNGRTKSHWPCHSLEVVWVMFLTIPLYLCSWEYQWVGGGEWLGGGLWWWVVPCTPRSWWSCLNHWPTAFPPQCVTLCAGTPTLLVISKRWSATDLLSVSLTRKASGHFVAQSTISQNKAISSCCGW